MEPDIRISRVKSCTGYIAVVALTCFMLCGATAPETCNTTPQPAPSHTGAIVGGVAIVAGVVIGTVVLVHVHHTHHEVKGCVLSGPDGLKLQTQGDQKEYKLAGELALVHEGDLVKIKGDKIKRAKGTADDDTFEIQKLSKDFGACKVPQAAATSK